MENIRALGITVDKGLGFRQKWTFYVCKMSFKSII